MLVELENLSQNGVIVVENGKVKVISYNELLQNLKIKYTELSKRLGVQKQTLDKYENANVIDNLNDYMNKFDNDSVKEKLVLFMAYQLLNDDINVNGVDYPSNYTDIRRYVYNPEDKVIPENFVKYVQLIKDITHEQK